MRTLSKPKQKGTTPQTKKEKPQKKEGKPQSKKVTKTIFNTPFRYKIQTLSIEDGAQVSKLLINFSAMIRSELMIPQKKQNNQKIIRFQSKISHQKPPLVCKYLIMGIKNNISSIKKNKLSLSILFYDQKFHDKFEELMCNILYHKVPYIVTRTDTELNKQIGLKQLLALGINHEQLQNQLLKYGSRCLIDIPWLVDSSWIPLNKDK